MQRLQSGYNDPFGQSAGYIHFWRVAGPGRSDRVRRTAEMKSITRNWRAVVGGVAAGSAAVLGIAGASASAEPVLPAPPVPVPAPLILWRLL